MMNKQLILTDSLMEYKIENHNNIYIFESIALLPFPPFFFSSIYFLLLNILTI